MILALNISVDSEGTIVDVYDKIFSLDNGGIYDRCIDKKSFGDRHRISKIKEKIHNISRDIAIWMFENEPEKATISKKEFDIGNKSDIKISQNDVTMTIKDGTLTNSGATLILTNNSDKNFQYGNPY